MTQDTKEAFIGIFTKILNILDIQYFICDALSEVASWEEFEEEHLELAHAYLMANRPTAKKFAKFYHYRHFRKTDDRIGWWAIDRRFRPVLDYAWDIREKYPKTYERILNEKKSFIRALMVQIENEEVETNTD